MKILNKTIILLPILILSLGVLGIGIGWAADTYWIAGAVAFPDDSPVENAALYLDGAWIANTGISGLFIIPEAAPGTHRLIPVKEGLVFYPEWVDVNLPPEAPDINFTAFEATDGVDSTSLIPLVVPTVQPTPTPALMTKTSQPLKVTFQGLAALIRSLLLLLALLSIGAFLALTVRRLRSGEWTLDYLFHQDRAEQLVEQHADAGIDGASGDSEPVQADEAAAGWLELGVAQVKRGELEPGEQSLRTAISLDESNAEAWFWLGVLKIRQGQVRTAKNCLLRAQRLGHPQAGDALSQLARR